jgi:hypothetical protein
MTIFQVTSHDFNRNFQNFNDRYEFNGKNGFKISTLPFCQRGIFPKCNISLKDIQSEAQRFFMTMIPDLTSDEFNECKSDHEELCSGPAYNTKCFVEFLERLCDLRQSKLL